LCWPGDGDRSLAIDYVPAGAADAAGRVAASAARVQHTLSAYLLGLALGQLGFVRSTDRYAESAADGRHRGLPLASVGCVLAAASMTRGAALRAGAGRRFGMVVIRAVIRDRFDEIQSARRAVSHDAWLMGAAPILAPLGGGWLLVHGSWHWIFGFLAAFALLCLLLVACISGVDPCICAAHRSCTRSPVRCRCSPTGASSGRRWFSSARSCVLRLSAAAPFVYIPVLRRAGGPVRLVFRAVRRASITMSQAQPQAGFAPWHAGASSAGAYSGSPPVRQRYWLRADGALPLRRRVPSDASS